MEENTMTAGYEPMEPMIKGFTGQLIVSLGAKAWVEHNRVVGLAAIILRVSNIKEAERAKLALQELAEFEASIDRAHEAAKKPAWDYCVELDKTKREILELVKAEKMRLAKLSGDWLALEESKTRALNNVRNEQLTQLEKEKEAELSRVTSHDERDLIQQQYAERAAALPKAEATKPKGQSLKKDWEIEVIDPVVFVSNHPILANVTVKLRETKALLDAGQVVRGIRATPINKARTAAAKPIDTTPAAPIALPSGDYPWFETPHSSQIARFGYDATRRILAIQFKTGALYYYSAVPLEVFNAFKAAESKGSYFGKFIKGNYRYQKQG